jgi:hypothetical protein
LLPNLVDVLCRYTAAEFSGMLESRKDELCGDVFDLLMAGGCTAVKCSLPVA